MTDRNNWNKKYWDIADQFYWAPQYIGMKSIPQRLWLQEGDRVSVATEHVNKTGPLYARARTADAHKVWMQRQEEILNHVFDIAFAIAPDALIAHCFGRPLGISDQGPYLSLGREIRQRYGWSKSENITQQDGLFVSASSVIGVELKLKSKSSPDQVIKYASVFAWEERHSGPRESLGLLYILENAADTKHWRACGLEGPQVDASLLDRVDIAALPKKVRDLVATDRDALSSILDRVSLAAITWADLRAACGRFRETLDQSRAGDQTLIRLIDGLVAQITEQALGEPAICDASESA